MNHTMETCASILCVCKIFVRIEGREETRKSNEPGYQKGICTSVLSAELIELTYCLSNITAAALLCYVAFTKQLMIISPCDRLASEQTKKKKKKKRVQSIQYSGTER